MPNSSKAFSEPAVWPAPAESSLPINENFLAKFQVLISNPESVEDYLNQSPGLREMLAPICEQVRKVFGSEAELSLALYRDPEIDDPYLTLYIRLPQYDAETVSRIDQISAAFANQLELNSGYLLLTTDFRPPRGSHAV